MYVVRQAHHERKKVNKSDTINVRPEPVEGQLSGVLQAPLMVINLLVSRQLDITLAWNGFAVFCAIDLTAPSQ